jgi:phosphoglycolate phosphatase-like HAD superfamily hydrolase
MLPDKIVQDLKQEALKYARFSWHQGWEKSSGYIKTTLSDDVRYGSCRLYIKWEKKKAPTDEQVKAEVEKAIERLLNNEEHHSTQQEFTRYVQNKYYTDVRRLKHQVELTLVDNLHHVIAAIQAYEQFELPSVQEFFNDLKNLDAGLSDHGALEAFLSEGRKRVGE